MQMKHYLNKIKIFYKNTDKNAIKEYNFHILQIRSFRIRNYTVVKPI